MKHYTSTIPLPLAEKLKEKEINIPTTVKYIIGNQVREYDKDYDGDMPIIGERKYHDGDLITFDRIDKECNPVCCNAPTYAEVFDWLLGEQIYVRIITFGASRIGEETWDWSFYIDQLGEPSTETDFFWHTWHEAATKAIEKALTLI